MRHGLFDARCSSFSSWSSMNRWRETRRTIPTPFSFSSSWTLSVCTHRTHNFFSLEACPDSAHRFSLFPSLAVCSGCAFTTLRRGRFVSLGSSRCAGSLAGSMGGEGSGRWAWYTGLRGSSRSYSNTPIGGEGGTTEKEGAAYLSASHSASRKNTAIHTPRSSRCRHRMSGHATNAARSSSKHHIQEGEKGRTEDVPTPSDTTPTTSPRRSGSTTSTPSTRHSLDKDPHVSRNTADAPSVVSCHSCGGGTTVKTDDSRLTARHGEECGPHHTGGGGGEVVEVMARMPARNTGASCETGRGSEAYPARPRSSSAAWSTTALSRGHRSVKVFPTSTAALPLTKERSGGAPVRETTSSGSSSCSSSGVASQPAAMARSKEEVLEASNTSGAASSSTFMKKDHPRRPGEANPWKNHRKGKKIKKKPTAHPHAVSIVVLGKNGKEQMVGSAEDPARPTKALTETTTGEDMPMSGGAHDREEERTTMYWKRKEILSRFVPEEETAAMEASPVEQRKGQATVQNVPPHDQPPDVSNAPSLHIASSSSSPPERDPRRCTGKVALVKKRIVRRRSPPSWTIVKGEQRTSEDPTTTPSSTCFSHLDSTHSKGDLKKRREITEVESGEANVMGRSANTTNSTAADDDAYETISSSMTTPPPPSPPLPSSSSHWLNNSSGGGRGGAGSLARLRKLRDRYTLLTLHQRLQHLAHSLYLRFTEWRQAPHTRAVQRIGAALERAIQENRVEAFAVIVDRIQQVLQELPPPSTTPTFSTRHSLRAQLLLLHARTAINLGVCFLLQFDTTKAISWFQEGIEILTMRLTEEEVKTIQMSLAASLWNAGTREGVTAMPPGTTKKSKKGTSMQEEEAMEAHGSACPQEHSRTSKHTQRQRYSSVAATTGGLSPSASSLSGPSKSMQSRAAAITAAVTAVSQAPFFSPASCVLYLRILLANAFSCEQRYWEAAQQFHLVLHEIQVEYPPAAAPVLVQIAPGIRGYQPLSRLFVKEEVASFCRHTRVLEEAMEEGKRHGEVVQSWWSRPGMGSRASTLSAISSEAPSATPFPPPSRHATRRTSAKRSSLLDRDSSGTSTTSPSTAATSGEDEVEIAGVGSGKGALQEVASTSLFREQREVLLALARLYRHAQCPSMAQACYEHYLQSLVVEGVEDSQYVMLELGGYLLYSSSLSGGAANPTTGRTEAPTLVTSTTDSSEGSCIDERSGASTSSASATAPSPNPYHDEQKANWPEISLVYLQAGAKLILEEAWTAFQKHYPLLLSVGATENRASSSPLSAGSAKPAGAAMAAKTIHLCARAAGALLDYSHALYKCGKGTKGLEVLERAIVWMEKTGLRYHSAWALTHCGDLLCAAGQMDKAILRYSKAIDVLKGRPISTMGSHHRHSSPGTDPSSFSSIEGEERGGGTCRSSNMAVAQGEGPLQISIHGTCVPLHIEEVESHLGYCFETSTGDYKRAVVHYQRALSHLLHAEEELAGEGATVQWTDSSPHENTKEDVGEAYKTEKSQNLHGDEEEDREGEVKHLPVVPALGKRSSSSSTTPPPSFRRRAKRYRRAFGGISTRHSNAVITTSAASSSSTSLHACLASKGSYSSPITTHAMLTGETALSPRLTPEGVHWILGRIVACHSYLKHWPAAVRYQKQLLQVESYVGVAPVESSLQLAALLQQAGNTDQALALYFTLFFLPEDQLTPATRVVLARKFGRCCYRLGCSQMGAVLLHAVKEAQGGVDPMTLLDLALCSWKAETSELGMPEREEEGGSKEVRKLNTEQVEAIRRIFKRAASLVVAHREIDKMDQATNEMEVFSPSRTEDDEIQALTVLNRGAFFFLEIGEEEKALELYSMALRICDEDSSAALLVASASESSTTPMDCPDAQQDEHIGSETSTPSPAKDSAAIADATPGLHHQANEDSHPCRRSRRRSSAYCQEWSVVLANSAMILAHRHDRKGEALQLYRKAAKVCPSSFPVLNAAALFCQSEGMLEDACFFLKRALQVPIDKVQREFHFLLTQLGETLFTKADAETKYLVLERALLSLGVAWEDLPSLVFSSSCEEETSSPSSAFPTPTSEVKKPTKEGMENGSTEGKSLVSIPFINDENLPTLVDNLGTLLEYGVGTTNSPQAASFSCFLLQTHFKEKAALLNRLFRIAITRFPKNPQLLFNYANFCTSHQFHFFARLYFARSLALQEDCTAAIHGYAAHLQHPTAFGTSHQGGTQEILLRRHSERYNAWNFYALLLYRQFPSPYKSEAVFERALKEDPNNTTTLSHYAEFLCLSLDSVRSAMNVHQREERLKRIEELLVRCVGISPEKSSSHYHLGVFYANCDRLTDALLSFQQAMEQNPRDVDSLRFIASLLKNECLQAKKAFLHSRQQSPSCSFSVSPGPTMSTSSTLDSSHHHHHPTDEERTKSLLNPRIPVALQDQMAQAEDCYEQAVALDPNHIPTLEEYAQFCISGLDKLDRAKELWIRISSLKGISDARSKGNENGSQKKK